MRRFIFLLVLIVMAGCVDTKTYNERSIEEQQDRVAKLRALCHGELTVEAQIGDWNDYVRITCVERRE